MKKFNKTTIYLVAASLIAGLLIGWLIFGHSAGNGSSEEQDVEKVETIWTCSMHPRIRQSEPGKCPICGMDLVPVRNQGSEIDPDHIRMSPTAMQLANVQTSVIRKMKPEKTVRMNGKVHTDERNISSQSSHIPGRIEKLMVSFTGEEIHKGQILAYVYSPELVTAQEELFEAEKIKESQPKLFEAVRSKLLNWKLTEAQIETILKDGKPQDQFPVLSDVSGIVLSKKVNPGDYIQKGQMLFEIADLSSVWVLFDVYESDIPWISKGNELKFTINSLPGESFKSRISFVDPVIDPKTRVAEARVEMSNRGMKLKPGMFAVGFAKSPITDINDKIIVPKSAVMWTGERSVVYVKHSDPSGVRFEMREITLGPSLGRSYIVRKGLESGTEIATNGTFSIDAAAQLAGKPSMMNPKGGIGNPGHAHLPPENKGMTTSPASAQLSQKAKEALSPVFRNYLAMKDALVQDNFEESKTSAKTLNEKLNKVSMELFTAESHEIWMMQKGNAVKALRSILNSENIGEVRQEFEQLSDALIMLAVSFGPFEQALYIQHCPMANSNNGADWISAKKQILNPYFGENMIGCGEVTREIK